MIGSTLEYYDYMLFALAAALVFPHVFFPDNDPAVATLLSLASYGVAYAARPLGAVILGTVGDRIGRKTLLQFTIIMMGVATFGIGVLPGYSAIGLAAPALLVLLRIIQGFSTAAEAAAGSAMTLEHASDDRRAFTSSWTMSGVQGGQALASLTFIPIAMLPPEALYSWGWRIPFLLSAVVVLVAVFIRRAVPETPDFLEAKERGELTRSFRVSHDLLLIRCRSADDTGVAYTRPSDIRLVRFDGTAGAPGELDNGYQVPKELPVHVESMRASPDIRAVAHL
ncbi:Permease, MFS superfamily protein, partial [Rhodococcus opacus M213]